MSEMTKRVYVSKVEMGSIRIPSVKQEERVLEYMKERIKVTAKIRPNKDKRTGINGNSSAVAISLGREKQVSDS